jgi:hypothetical protein
MKTISGATRHDRKRQDAAKTVKKKKGWQRPGPGRQRLDSLHVMLTINREMRAEVDAWIADQPDKPRSYPDAIRRLMRPTLDRWLKNKSK